MSLPACGLSPQEAGFSTRGANSLIPSLLLGFFFIRQCKDPSAAIHFLENSTPDRKPGYSGAKFRIPKSQGGRLANRIDDPRRPIGRNENQRGRRGPYGADGLPDGVRARRRVNPFKASAGQLGGMQRKRPQIGRA